tara:strand:+ start:559 stop:1395 length:837 start_codon:yes stop_codon:yes gene_type:complete
MAKENTAKFNELQQTVTDQIIAQLESGDLGLWQKEWLSCGMPENPLSGTKYKGANVIILLMARARNGYSTNKWTTSAALRKLGHHVLAGNKATLITKPTSFVPIDDDTKIPVSFGCQPVFNLDQTSMEIEPENYEMLGDDNIEADKIIDAMTKDLASVVYNGDQAYYRRATDLVNLPENFKTTSGKYATAFHEFGHATMHESRLDREAKGSFGTPEYAYEELVAEMTSAFLCADTKVEGELQHASYIKSWIKLLKDDNKALFSAASKATAAYEYIKAA